MGSLRARYSSAGESGFSFQQHHDAFNEKFDGQNCQQNGDTPALSMSELGTSLGGLRTVAPVSPEVARMPSLDSDPALKAAVSHAERRQRTGLDSQTGLKCSWLDLCFHVPSAGLQDAQPLVKMEAVVAPAASGCSSGRQQNVDWLRIGVSKSAFMEQLVAPLASWAWEGSGHALDMRRFNYGPEQGALVWCDANVIGSAAVDHFRKTDGGEGPPITLADAMLQVTAGGQAAVRATLLLRVSLSTLPGGGSVGRHGRSGSNGEMMSPRKGAAPGSYRPVFTVAGVYISGLAPAKLKEPTFAAGPLLHGNIDCAAIAAVGSTRSQKPVAFGSQLPKGGSRARFASPDATSRLEPPAVMRTKRDPPAIVRAKQERGFRP